MHDPVAWNGVVQLVKTAAAAVVAWVIADRVLDLPQPFLAPWAALLVVHATVYRTFSRGLQQVVAAVVGVLLAAAVGQVLGLDTVAVAVLLVAGLVIGSLRWFGAEATTVAATALVVLTTGYADDTALVSRLLDTGIGIGVGLVVNVLVWPPLRRRTAIVVIDQLDDGIGELLHRIAQQLEDGCEEEQVGAWIERSRDLDAELDEAWSLVRQARESAWMNPRRSAHSFRDPQEWYGLLRRMEQAIAEIRSMARTLGGRETEHETRTSSFDDRWTRLLREAGQAVQDADAAALDEVRQGLEALVVDLSAGEQVPSRWPLQGALVTNLRNVLDAMAEVTAVNPLDRLPAVIDRLPRRPSARGA